VYKRQLLGSVWGKYAWGDWWGWDPKELWSLVCWLVYSFYLHWRAVYGKKHLKMNLSLSGLGFICIIITLLWVNLSKLFSGLHSYA
jgi:ABC-type transport system involved in cytochrome c biogenesis permease subunit